MEGEFLKSDVLKCRKYLSECFTNNNIINYRNPVKIEVCKILMKTYRDTLKHKNHILCDNKNENEYDRQY